MVVKINLLPIDVVRRRRRKVALLVTTLGVAAIWTCLVFHLTISLLYLNNLEKECRMVQEEIDILRPKVAELERLEEEIEKMKERRRLIERLQSGRFVWVKFMDNLCNLIPRGIWLNNLTPKAEGEWYFSISLDGVGVNNFEIAQLMVNLMNFAEFENVVLTQITTGALHEHTVKNFGLTWYFRPQI